MKKIKVCYTLRDNLGDSINPLIFKKVLGFDVVRTDEYKCDLSGIGSGLRRFFINPSINHFKRKIIKGGLHPKKVYLFSAGFLTTPSGNEKCLRKNMEVVSVRGELSKKYVSLFLKRDIECTTGDAGLLCSRLIENEFVEKRYDIGIIPHDKERDEQFFKDLKQSLPNSTIIDVRGNPYEIVKRIAECKTIISSSLHGLIIADSFHIPNLHVKLTNKLSGDGFKFRDYYSCFGIDDFCVDLLKDSNLINKRFIEANYKIDIDSVERKKCEIEKAMCYIASKVLKKNL